MNDGQLIKHVIRWQEGAQEWRKLHTAYRQLERGAKPFLASLKNTLRRADPKASDTALEREALATQEYQDFMNRLCLAEDLMLEKEIRKDGLLMMYEAARSEMAHEREGIKKGIFDRGGK